MRPLQALVAGLLAGTFLPIDAARSQNAPNIESLKTELNALQIEQAAAQRRIEALEARLRALEAQGLGSGALLPDASTNVLRGRGVGQASSEPPPADSAVAAASSDEASRKSPAPTEAVEAVTQAEQGHFGERINIEPGITYSHFSNAALNLSGFLALDAIFLGLISIDEVKSDVLTYDLTARMGLTRRLQADVNVPYIFRRSNFRSGGAGGSAAGLAEKTLTEHGLSDVSMGLSYHLLRETASRPDVVINARVKAPTGKSPFGVELVEVPGTEGNLNVPSRLSTGSGVWGASVGLSLLKTIDPMVVFGSLTYFRNFERRFDDLDEAAGDQGGKADLGDAIQYGVGVAYALNDRSSLSMSLTQRFVQRAKLLMDVPEGAPGPEWRPVVGSQANVGVLNLGATFSLNPRTTFLFNLGAGLTGDASDMVISLRLPYQF